MANCLGKAAQHLLCIAVSVMTTQYTETVNELPIVWQLEARCKAFGFGRKAWRFAGRDHAVLWDCLQLVVPRLTSRILVWKVYLQQAC